MTPGPTQPPAAPKKKDASTPALVLGFIGVCCFPLGIVAAIIAISGIAAAKREGRPVPAWSIVTLVLTVFSVLLAVVGWIQSSRLQAEKEARVGAAKEKLAGKLDGATLDAETACALANLSFEKSFDGPSTCGGTFTPGPVSVLTGVKNKRGAHTVCFAKAHRWYVLSSPRDGVCPTEAPPAPASKPTSDEAFEQQEDELRAAEAKRAAKGQVERYLAKLAAVRELVDTAQHAEKKCPAFDGPTKASHVDADLLPGAGDDFAPWKLLSDDEHRMILAPKADDVAKAKAIDDALSRSNLLAVFYATDAKALPIAEKKGFIGGEFDGWLSIVDVEKNEIVCDTALHFESSETVGGGVKLKFVPDKSVKSKVEDDFEKRFKEAARKKANELSNFKLSLGLGFLD